MAEPVWIQSSRVARTLLLHQHLCAHIYNRIKFPTFSGYFRFIYCFIWPKFCVPEMRSRPLTRALLMVWWWCYCYCFCCYNCFYHFDILPRLNNNKTTEQATNQPNARFLADRWFYFLEIFGKRKLRGANLLFYNQFFLHFDIDSHSKYPNIHLEIRERACESAHIQTDYYHIQHSSTHFK